MKPDIMTFGKALSGGFTPASGIVADAPPGGHVVLADSYNNSTLMIMPLKLYYYNYNSKAKKEDQIRDGGSYGRSRS
jgi:adenosylmethionine-8-amino-7-oxononanoate aminotransferase